MSSSPRPTSSPGICTSRMRSVAAMAKMPSANASRRLVDTGERYRRGRLEPVNRLAQETSPYLLQHADTPVDWSPWGDEALERAQAEDKPLLLSVGYAACHWCHVMQHE